MIDDSTILDCGHVPSTHGPHTTGYGIDPVTNAKSCYACCAALDQAYMIQEGRISMYLTGPRSSELPRAAGSITIWARNLWTLGNWPSSLRFKINRLTKSRHNIGRVRYDAWFNGPDGHVWHAVSVGLNTDIAHCKRTRAMWRKSAA